MAVAEPMGVVCGWSVAGLTESGEGFWLRLLRDLGEGGIGSMDFCVLFLFLIFGKQKEWVWN